MLCRAFGDVKCSINSEIENKDRSMAVRGRYSPVRVASRCMGCAILVTVTVEIARRGREVSIDRQVSFAEQSIWDVSTPRI